MNLAKFAFLYKSSMLTLSNVNGGKEASIHSFLAGLFGGYWVFGHGRAANSSVNQQIVIYVFARVVLALAKLAVQPPGDNSLVGSSYGGHGGKGMLGLTEQQLNTVRKNSWPVFASMSWASVMWLFRQYPEMLQPSLRSSMTYMYVDFFFSPRSFVCRIQQRLTSMFLSLDMIMRTNGMARGISFGTTSDSVHLARRSWIPRLYIPISLDILCNKRVESEQPANALCQLRQLRALAQPQQLRLAASASCCTWHASEARLVTHVETMFSASESCDRPIELDWAFDEDVYLRSSARKLRSGVYKA